MSRMLERDLLELLLELENADELCLRDRREEIGCPGAAVLQAHLQRPGGEPGILPRPDRRGGIGVGGAGECTLDRSKLTGNAVKLPHGGARVGEGREATIAAIGNSGGSRLHAAGAPLVLAPAARTADVLAALGAPAENLRHSIQFEIT